MAVRVPTFDRDSNVLIKMYAEHGEMAAVRYAWTYVKANGYPERNSSETYGYGNYSTANSTNSTGSGNFSSCYNDLDCNFGYHCRADGKCHYNGGAYPTGSCG